ncbi:MAG: hypothetical protein R6W94_04535 [Spirochaetia bacterium]
MMKRAIIGISFVLLFTVGLATVSADNGLRPWDHGRNPAFFDLGAREYAELGFSVDVSGANSVMALSDIFSKELVIDLDEIYEKTPDRGMRLGSSIGTEQHLSVKLDRIGFGFFGNTRSFTRLTVPKEFIGLITQGNELDGSYSDSTELAQRSFTQAGAYATYEYLGFVFGGKFSTFAPLVYTDSNAKATFELATAADGTIEGEVSASGDVYTSAGEDGLVGTGFNLSLGVVRPDENGKALYGGAINSIPLVAARPGYAFNLEKTRFTFTTDSILDAINNDRDPFSTSDTEGEADTVALDEGDRPKIHMPISISGFYRFAVPVVDVVPSAEIVFGDYARLNAEVNVEGNFFPVNILSVGFGHTDSLWHAGAGLRAPLRVFELELQVRSVGTEIAGVFDGRGIGATLALALGY